MANKTLTAKVKLDIGDVEHKIKRLNNLFNSINTNMNKASGGSALENTTKRATESLTEYDKAARRLAANQEKIHRKEYENWWKTALAQQDAINKELKLERVRQRSIKTLGNGDKAARRLAQATEQIKRREYEAWWQAQLLNQEYRKAHPILSRLPTKVQEWWKKQQQVQSSLKATNNTLGSVFQKVKQVVGLYAGIQGLKAVMNTSDSITSAKNRFNNLDDGSPEKTAESMDKIYAAAQRSRTGYEDMLSNVSKTMTLAGDSFQDNIDNAIRFQEIMAKAYTVGGASDTEAATSMYQLVQALGSGVLQGDELRSVREGAPLAYKAIEKFAQGVYDTDESLKKLAADGKVTSDMVVAAIMDADFSGKLEKQFENTQATFEQTFAKIKNMAMKAFEPVLEKINKLLNSEKGERLIEGIGYALVILGNILYWVLDIFATFFNWCAENWEWLKYVIAGVALVILGILVPAFLRWAAVAIITAIKNIISFVSQYWALLLIVAGIMAILYVYELWRQGTIATTEAIVYCLFIIAAMALITGIALGAMWLIWVAVGIAAIALILMFFSEFCGGINVGIQAIVNAWFWMGNLILGVWNWVCAALTNAARGIANFFIAVFNWICAVGYNAFIGIVNAGIWMGTLLGNVGKGIANFFVAAFNWICAAGSNAFAGIGNFGMALANAIGAIASNIGTAFSNAWIFAKNTFWEFLASVIDGVSKLEPVINGIASLLGKEGVDFGALSSSIREKKESYKEFVSVGDAWNSGLNTFGYKDLGEAWSSGINTFQYDELNGSTYEYKDIGDAWSSGINTYQYENLGDAWDKGWNTYDVFQDGWASDAYNSGYDWGQGIEDKINDWGKQFQNKDAKSYDGIFSDIGKLIDTDKLLGDNALPNVNDPAYDIKGAWDEPTVDELLSGVDDIKDSMDIADDDLEWMRRIAEMEWRNEFTTAEIKVDMTNNNTVNSDRDLDGIVEYLSDVLRSEMTSVAYGTHY